MQIGADTVDDKKGPTEIDDDSEEKISVEVSQLDRGTDGGSAEEGEGIDQEGAENERGEHDGPQRKRLTGEMGEDDFGGHTAEDEGHGETEEHEMMMTSYG